MSDVIRFLDSMGSQSLSPVQYAATVAALDIDASQRQALLDRDPAALSELLGGRDQMRCFILVPDELNS